MINEFNVEVNSVELNVNVINEDPVEVVTFVTSNPTLNVEVVATGPRGEQGIQGVKGDPFKYEDFTSEQLAGLNTDLNYTHDQIASSKTWTVNHGLNKYPSVSVVDSAGSLVIGEVTHINSNQLVLTFNAMFSGKAYLN